MLASMYEASIPQKPIDQNKLINKSRGKKPGLLVSMQASLIPELPAGSLEHILLYENLS